jgi:ferredoxin--NADP+ reductase/benzoate/toluate 1,2-dioxygenase reductase subunit
MSHVVIDNRHLTESTFILRFTRAGMQFRAGQHIIVGLSGELDMREYSIYSGENDDYLEVLIREVKEGKISGRLKLCKPGQKVDVNGPFGSFGIESYDRHTKKLVFVATGTGIAPFHSMVRSYSGLDYTILHGVRFSKEAYEKSEYDPGRYILCASRDNQSGHTGRVTRLLQEYKVSDDMQFYLCGNGNMINEVYEILTGKGVSPKNIFTERYF